MKEECRVEDLELLEDSIRRQIRALLQNIDVDRNAIQVHFFSGSRNEDLTRSVFTLLALAKALVFLNVSEILQLKNLVKVFENKIFTNFEPTNILAVVYLIRLKNILEQDLKGNLEFLENQELNILYTHPVSMYVFVSMVHELKLEKTSYLFSIRNECLKIFEYLLFSGDIDSKLLFSLAEINYWQNDLPENQEFLKEGNKYLINRLGREDLKNISSSGLTKCLEFVSLLGQENANMKKFLMGKILLELENRRVKNIPKNIQNINFRDKFKNENMYIENYGNAHICLDSNSHLLLAYLNSYSTYEK